MKPFPAADPDRAFGQIILTVRDALGLTQAALAGHLGVSRRAVGDWEAGNKYPKVEHLKELIALAVQRGAFTTGREADEIQALWRAAHQRVLLDEAWLSAILRRRSPAGGSPARAGGESTPPVPVPAPVLPAPSGPPRAAQREIPATIAAVAPVAAPPLPPEPEVVERIGSGARTSQAPDALAPAPRPRADWGSAPIAPPFYGREWELALLTEWVVQERCRVVSVLGLGGIGKSALAVSAMHRLADQFELVIWRSLRDLPTGEALLQDLLQTLTPPGLGEERAGFAPQLSALLEHLRQRRVLLVLDNLESVLAEGESTGHLRPGYENFGQLLHRVAETAHQSCLLLTSRESSSDLVPLEGSHSPVRALRLARLDDEACAALLAEKGVQGTAAERARLIDAYAGNPLALIIVSRTIADLFDGDLALFLEQGETIYGGIRQLLSDQFRRLSALEQGLLTWLAIMREPMTFDRLRSMLVTPFPPTDVLEAVEGLHHRHLIERGPQPGSFTLQSVILEYVIVVLLAEASEEIRNGRLDRLIKHGLELAYAKDYVRETQERLLVAPLLARLHALLRGDANLEAQLIALLDQMRELPADAQGYGPANLLALLRLQRGGLHGLDLSRLGLRGVNLQGVAMQDTSLAGASIRDSVFRETFEVLTAVAISQSGQYWAAAGRRGQVRVWVAMGTHAAPWALTLRAVWQAHTERARALVLSPDERTLVSGGWDGALKMWDLSTSDLLWSGWHTSNINSVAFAPDGRMLASCGSDATVRLWDSRSGTQLQVLPHPGPVLAVAWRQDRLATEPGNEAAALLASGDLEGTIRLWAIRGGEPATPAILVRTLQGHTNWVWGLAFAPHDSTLASASWDGSVKLWDSHNGHLRKTLIDHKEWMNRVVWSADGRTLAGAGRDARIWLWDADTGRSVAALSGHSPGIWGLAFVPATSPGSQSLVSTGEDGTLRVWDIASTRCVQVMRGFTATLYDLGWSPDGMKLVSGGSNAAVTIWDIGGGAPPKVLLGHRVAVFGVAWSPDGRWIASSEWDNAIRLWNPEGGERIEVPHDPGETDQLFYGLSWSPDGQRLACGTYTHGVQVFERAKILAGSAAHSICHAPTWIGHVGWSPDGTRLAGGGDDGTVYVWDTADNTLQHRLAGHQGAVKTLAWSPNSAQLAAGAGPGDGGGGEVEVWDAESGDRLDFSAPHPAIVYAVAWGFDEKMLISGDGVGLLRWWDVRTGECVRVREAHQGTIQTIRRSPDGTKLASCGHDGAIMIWDLQTGQHLQTHRHDRPYERLNITGVRGLTEAQKATLRTLGAIEDS